MNLLQFFGTDEQTSKQAQRTTAWHTAKQVPVGGDW